MNTTRVPPRKFEATHIKNHVDRFLKVDEYTVSYEQYDEQGGGSGTLLQIPHPMLVMERGDSVAALLFDLTEQEVILVEQFRFATTLRKGHSGWITELPAGALQSDETPEQCIQREIVAETGYQVTSLVPISTFFLSPGGTSERIMLYYAEVRQTRDQKVVAGDLASGENTFIVREKLTQFYAKLRNREYEDAKLIIAGYWLRDRLYGLKAGGSAQAESARHEVLAPAKSKPTSFLWRKSKKYIGFIAGDIVDVEGVAAWVNPLTNYLELDRFDDRTISGSIRAGGATWDDAGNIRSDDVGEALRKAKGGRQHVAVGEVVVTDPGKLSEKVDKIIHVAITRMGPDRKPVAHLSDIPVCIEKILDSASRHNLASVAIPLIGTGTRGFVVKDAAREIVEALVDHFNKKPQSRVSEIYLVPYSATDVDEVKSAISKIAGLGAAEPRPQ